MGSHALSLVSRAGVQAACPPACPVTTPLPTCYASPCARSPSALQLHALRRTYGCNVCGEGGEYETLTLDCPLFKHGRIVLDSWHAVAVSEDSMAPVALLHPTAFHVEQKEAAPGSRGPSCAADGEAGAGAPVIQVPDDWVPSPAATAAQQQTGAPAEEPAEPRLDVRLGVADGRQYCSLTASVSPAGGATADQLRTAAGTATALGAALGRLSQALPALGLNWRASLFVHMYVPSMAQFAAANVAYAATLPAVNPPSRATVQLSSSSGGDAPALVVEVLFARWGRTRPPLGWAPLCDGLVAAGRAGSALQPGCKLGWGGSPADGSASWGDQPLAEHAMKPCRCLVPRWLPPAGSRRDDACCMCRASASGLPRASGRTARPRAIPGWSFLPGRCVQGWAWAGGITRTGTCHPACGQAISPGVNSSQRRPQSCLHAYAPACS